MARPTFFDTPGYGPGLFESTHYHQAVRIGDRVEISGQGGWDEDGNVPESLEDEIAQAFENVERTLRTAGASWRDVVAVQSFHVPERADRLGDTHHRVLVEQLRKHMGERAPILTAVGVPALDAEHMRVEITVTAVVDQD